MELSARHCEAVYILCVLNARLQRKHLNIFDDLLALVARLLGLSIRSLTDKYQPILQSIISTPDIKRMTEPYIELLTEIKYDPCCLLFEMMYVFVTNNQYHATHRSFFKSLCNLLGVASSEFSRMESNLNLFLNNPPEEFLYKKTPTDKPCSRQSLFKYAQVGCVSIGVGALAAVAGGLAAPAIVASIGLLATAGATKACLFTLTSHISATATGSLFGTMGMGLSGYKMSKRLQGLEEFSFETYNKGHLAVCIFVSGWMETDKNDYQRVFGVPPSVMGLKERLHRFYKQHDESKISSIDAIILEYNADEDIVRQHLLRDTGFDIMKEEHLLSLPREVNLSSDYWKVYCELANENLRYDFKEPKKSSLSATFDPMEGVSDEFIDIDLSDDERAALLTESDSTAMSPFSAPPPEYWNWRDLTLSDTHELYILRWETDLQLQLGDTLTNIFRQFGSTIAKNVILSSIPFGAAIESINHAVSLPLCVIRLTDYIDDVWSLAERRADLAGHELSLAIIAKYNQDRRPVNLVGFSVGARVIFSCLKHLKISAPAYCEYMIEDVVLLGAPLTADPNEWLDIRDIVNGRLVNGYTSNDLLLRCVYRLERFRLHAAGIAPVDCSDVENYDLSTLIGGHSDYRMKIKDILEFIHCKN